MKLSELLRERNSQFKPVSAGNPEQATIGSIRSLSRYSVPVDALLNGRPVKLTHTGDIVGMSPAEKYIDENQKSDWASTDDFVFIDSNVTPRSAEQLRRQADHLQKLQGQ
jgi:hypothetical protein